MDKFNNCPLCAHESINELKGFEKRFLYKCPKCNLVFDIRIPSEEELYDQYKQYSYSSLKECSNQTINSYNNLLDQFEAYKKTGNILDVSCGQGDFLNEARKRGWNICGTEFSDAAVNICRQRNITMAQGALSHTMFVDMEFDVITSFEVIEHINNPSEHFEILNKKLRRGGLLYCTTPNFNALLRYFERDNFMMICYPEHITFYTKSSFTYLARNHGFLIQKLLTTGLDIGRLKNYLSSIKKNKNLGRNEKRIEAKTTTDDFRREIDTSLTLKLIKNMVNVILSLTGTGDTLKAFIIKQ